MSLEGDARSERQSSAEGSPLVTWLAAARRFARPAFGIFLLLHLACQVYRAEHDAEFPEPGLELRPWFVAGVLLLVGVPFTSLVVHALQRRRAPQKDRPARTEQVRALAVAEQLALLVVVLFTTLHVAGTAWPLLSGEHIASDVRPELVLSLSSTSQGVPLHAVGYVCGAGAAAFYATRQALRALGSSRVALARGVVVLGILAYLLGSYAVIRCAGGAIFS